MNTIGTSGNDLLSPSSLYTGSDFVAGMAGNDTIDVGYQSYGTFLPRTALGGAGDDTYILESGSKVVIADSGGHDTLKLPLSLYGLESVINSSASWSAVYDGRHFYCETSYFDVLLLDFQGAGKVESFVTSDNVWITFDQIWSYVKDYVVHTGPLSQASFAMQQRANDALVLRDQLSFAEYVYANAPTADWFDDSIYMKNKAVASGLSASALSDAFINAGFYGENGDYLHFLQYGQWEDVSPIATFDADYYYKSKAADFFHRDISRVTAAQAEEMRDAIHNAGMNAWSHYQMYGTREGIDASARFDTSAYMEAKLAQMRQVVPDYTMDQLYQAFENAGLSAAAHYEAYGKAEGIQIVGVPTAFTADVADQENNA